MFLCKNEMDSICIYLNIEKIIVQLILFLQMLTNAFIFKDLQDLVQIVCHNSIEERKFSVLTGFAKIFPLWNQRPISPNKYFPFKGFIFIFDKMTIEHLIFVVIYDMEWHGNDEIKILNMATISTQRHLVAFKRNWREIFVFV